MADTASLDRRDTVSELASLLALHDGMDVKALDLGKLNAFTDFFIIATANSSVHMAGLMKRIKDFLSERGIDVLGRHKGRDDDDWSLVDCGWLVVHLMSSRARSFYEIEKLWFQALPVPIREPERALSAESDAKASRQE